MSTNQLRQATSGQAPARQEAADPKSIMGLLQNDSVKKQMAMAMPSHMTPDRLMRIALTEIRKTPALGKCNVQSFMGAIMQCSQLGLEPGAALGHAYLLPFGNGKASDGLANCQLIIGYRGMIDLARRSGQIISLSSRSVHANDAFSYEYGLEETLYHKPAEGERGDLTHVYAVAKLVGGGIQFEVMSKADILKVKASSRAGSNGPWVSHFDEMAKKSVIRRLFKYLPVSIEITRAVVLDEKADAGIDQDNRGVLTGEYTVTDEQPMLGQGEQLDELTGEVTMTQDASDRGTDAQAQARTRKPRQQKPAQQDQQQQEFQQEPQDQQQEQGPDFDNLNME